jgi:hypothetical protein
MQSPHSGELGSRTLPGREKRGSSQGLAAVEALNDSAEQALHYRQRAAELLAMSEREKDANQRRVLVDLATTFHRMAEQLERLKDRDPTTK